MYDSPAYRAAYARINGMVIVGEGLAYRHFRQLAEIFPEDRQELDRLAAMESGHARDFVGCGINLGIKPDLALARDLFAPLHALFLEARRSADRVGPLVIQCLVVESFALAAYRGYLPVADPYAAPITRRVMADEDEHLNYGERRLSPAGDLALDWCTQALPITLAILRPLLPDVAAIGMEATELVAEFADLLQGSLERIGIGGPAARRTIARSVGRALAAPAP